MQEGVHIVHKWNGNVPDYVYTSDAVCITICRYWRDLNPSDGVYDWADLDTDIANVLANGKSLGIKIAAGCDSPNWVKALTGTLTFEEFVGNATTLTTFIQPIFYHPDYLTKWTTFITALSAHLQADSDVWNALTNVSITGINRRTDEFRICSQASETRGDYTSTDAPALWLSESYTEDKIMAVQSDINDLFATQFSGKDYGFSMVNYGGTPPFPNIGTGRDLNQENLNLLTAYTGYVYGMFTSVTSNFVSDTVTTQAINAGLYAAGQLNEKEFGSGTASYEDLNTAMQAAHTAGYKYMEIHDDSVPSYNQYIPQYNLLFSESAQTTSDMVHFSSQEDIDTFIQKSGALATQIGYKWVKLRDAGAINAETFHNNYKYIMAVIPALCGVTFGSTTNMITDAECDQAYENIIKLGNICDSYNLLSDRL